MKKKKQPKDRPLTQADKAKVAGAAMANATRSWASGPFKSKKKQESKDACRGKQNDE